MPLTPKPPRPARIEPPEQRAEKLASVKARVYVAQAKERARALPVLQALMAKLRGER